jgi:hypothetical protein
LQTLYSRCRSAFTSLRRQVHLIKFNILLDLGRFRTWFSAKLHSSRLIRWLNNHILCQKKKPEPRRPLFRRGGEPATSRSGSAGTSSGGDEKKGRIRRLSQSTVKSLKKACSLNSERSELKEEDRRAMERLEELWRTRDVHSI